MLAPGVQEYHKVAYNVYELLTCCWDHHCITFLLQFPAPRVAPMVATPVPTTTTINVTWNELACQDHRGVITHYEVRYNTSDFNEDKSLTLNTTMGDDTCLMIENLEEFGNYTIEARAHTAAGAGPYSSPIDVQTLPDSK